MPRFVAAEAVPPQRAVAGVDRADGDDGAGRGEGHVFGDGVGAVRVEGVAAGWGAQV